MKRKKLAKKIISLTLVVVMVATCLGNYQIAMGAGLTSKEKTVVQVNDTASLVNAINGNADIIEFVGNSILSGRENDDKPVVINRDVTIDGKGKTFIVNHAGIVLGGNVTFKNINLSFANSVRNMIVANGHDLTLENVKSTGTWPVNVVAGYLTEIQSDVAKQAKHGNGGTLTFKGEVNLGTINNCTGSVFLGSVSDAAEDARGNITKHPYDKETIVNIDIRGNKSTDIGIGGFFPAGGRENRYGSGVGNESIIIDEANFNVTGNVTYNLYNSNYMNIDGETAAPKKAVLNYYKKDTDSYVDFNRTTQLKGFSEINVKSGMFEPQNYQQLRYIDNINVLPGKDTAVRIPVAGSLLMENGDISVAKDSELSIRTFKTPVRNISGEGTIVVDKIGDNSPKYQYVNVTGTIAENMKVNVKKESKNMYGGLVEADINTGGPLFFAPKSTNKSFVLVSSIKEKLELEKYAERGTDGYWRITKPIPKFDSFNITKTSNTIKASDLNDENGTVSYAVESTGGNFETMEMSYKIINAKTQDVIETITSEKGTNSDYNTIKIAHGKVSGLMISQDLVWGQTSLIVGKEKTSQGVKPGIYNIKVTAPLNDGTSVVKTITLEVTGEDTVDPSPSEPDGGETEKGKTSIEIQTNDATAKDGVYNNAPIKGYTGEPTAEGVSELEITYQGTIADGNNTAYGPIKEMPKKVGSYTVTFGISEENPDYKCDSPLVLSFKITKAAGQTLTKDVSLEADKTSLTVTGLADLMPTDAEISEYKLGQIVNNTDTEITDGKVATNGTLTATVGNATANDVITFPVTVKSNNYEDSVINVVLTIKEGKKPMPENPGKDPTPGKDPAPDSGNTGGGGNSSGGGSVTPPKPPTPADPDVNPDVDADKDSEIKPDVKPDGQKPILPIKPPTTGANIGMEQSHWDEINNTIDKIVQNIVKNDEKPAPETEAEKETAVTEQKIKDAVKTNKAIRVNIQAEKIDEKNTSEKIDKEINHIKDTVKKELKNSETKYLQFVNIDVVAQSEKDGKTTDMGYLRNLDQDLEFSFMIPDDKVGKNMVVVRYHDGKAEIIPSKTDGNKVTFKTNKFSTYALIEYAPIVTPEPPVKPEEPQVKPEQMNKPGVVQKVTVKTDNGLLKVSFNKVKNADKYKVYIRQVGNKGGWKWYITKNSSLMISKLYKKDLIKNGKYQVKVAAVNKGGEGKTSPIKTVYANRVGSKSAVMPAPKFTSITSKKGTVKVVVKNIKFKTSPKTVLYKVSYRQNGTNKWIDTKYTAKNIKTIKGLKRGKTYSFALKYKYKSSLDSKTYVYSWVVYKKAKIK